MKIGLVTGEFPPMEGGVGAFTQELARALHSAGHEIHIITSRDARPEDAERTFRTRNHPLKLDFAFLHPRIERWRWPSNATVVDILLRHDLDIINIQYQAAAYNMHSAAINLLPWRLKGITTTIVTFHDLRVPYLFPKAGSLRRSAVRYMAQKAHGVIATNSADYTDLAASISTPAAQIPIGSNINAYTPNHVEIAEAQEHLHLSKEDRLIGYFGFLNESKGADTLLQALATLGPQYHLVFIGGQTGASDPTNKDFMEQLQSMIAHLGLSQRVHWTGFLTDLRVSTYLHAADLLAMPYQDGASLRRGTLMAALAHGRPLISTNPTEATPELQHGENVWLVPVGDPAQLAQAVEKLSADEALRRSLGKQAEQTARLFSWEHIAAATAKFYAQISEPIP